ncbi:MAG: WYL domain-containing protein [Firmicutes bacterium]|nr:WYL domain-containing protein [Bacillota bacterium]
MAYSELIKNFEKIRAYMREFYVYGFKSRTEYDIKSARSYDNEKRRLESWLGDHMRFTQTAEGKNVFLSVDSRVTRKNPFYKAWKAKSFTDGDITLYFLIFDILHVPEIKKTLGEIVEEIDERLSSCMTFDESTIRKKLKEYAEEGIIHIEKEGRKVLYSRSAAMEIEPLQDLIDFFSEVAPCGVVGSFLQDKQEKHDELFSFKHHYITQAMDSDVMAVLFEAMHKKSYVTVDNVGRHSNEVKTLRLVPLKIYISAQNGRQNLVAYYEKGDRLNTYRLDYMSNVKIEEAYEQFDELKAELKEAEKHMWGVNCKRNAEELEHVEFVIRATEDEFYIVQRLNREKRCGQVEKIDDVHYRYTADVFDSNEMLPWIRTFISRITKISFSNQMVEEKFKADICEMYRMYGIDGGETDDIQ